MSDAEGERIDFISDYCDRWCERCQFTARCSLFACTVSIAMCGDVRDGIQLAVGAPAVPGESDPESKADEWLPSEMNEADLDAAVREEKVLRAAVEKTSLMQLSLRYFDRSCQWIDAHQSLLASDGSDPVLHEAGEIVARDSIFFIAKVHRALDGRYRSRSADEEWDNHPVQNDWNGSAKIALLSVQRSRMAWQTIADARLDTEAAAIAAIAADLIAQIEREFPDAWSFVRPGFDRLP